LTINLKFLPMEAAQCFTFKNVLTVPFVYFLPIAVVIGFPFFFIYATIGVKAVGVFGLVVVFLLVFGLFKLFIDIISKTVEICFAGNRIIINNQEYKKDQILGIYMRDYEERQTSIISFEIWFVNGKKLEITDTEYRNQYNPKKGDELYAFIRTLKRELNFIKTKKDNFRAMQGRAAYWYSRKR